MIYCSITADGDYSLEIKRWLLLGRKAMINLDSILKSRDIILLTKVHLVKAMVFPVWMWELDHKESWAPKNWCFWTAVGKCSWESLGLQGDPTSPSYRKSVLNIHWKDWCWSLSSNALATWCKEPIHWKRPWCWERLKVGEGDNREWEGWMASPTWCTWVWANFRSWWWTGRPSVLQSMGLQRVGHDWATELNGSRTRSRTRQECPPSSLLFNIVLEVLDKLIRQGKKFIQVLTSAAHILKLERYREYLRGPQARMTHNFMKHSKLFIYLWLFWVFVAARAFL